MMFYNNELISSLKEKRKKIKMFLIIFSAIVLAICVVLCFFVNDDTETAIEIFNCVFMTLCGWFVIAIYFLKIQPIKYRLDFITELLQKEPKEVQGKVTAIGKTITISKNVTAIEITLDGDAKHLLYWETLLGTPTFEIENEVKFSIIDGCIVGVQNDK